MRTIHSFTASIQTHQCLVSAASAHSLGQTTTDGT